MKKLISLAICLAMVLAFSVSGFAAAIIKPGVVLKDPAVVTEFKEMVDAIGEVTLEDKDAIEAAEAFYDENNLGKYVMEGMRQNATCIAAYETLTAAREAYDALVANQGSSEVAPGGDSSSEVAPGGGSSSEVAPGGDGSSEVAPGGDGSSEVAPGGDSGAETPDTPDTPVEPEKPARDPKTLTVGERAFTAAGDKWLYNEAVTKTDAAKYSMIIFDKGFEGTFETNEYGAAVVLNEYGELVKIYDGANIGFWTVEGKAATTTITKANFASLAFSELEDGELLIIFPNDGVNDKDSARTFALGLRNAGTSNPSECGKTCTLTGFTFKTRPVNPPVDDPIDPPVDPIDPTGDSTFVVFALVALSMTGLVVLTSKKRAF